MDVKEEIDLTIIAIIIAKIISRTRSITPKFGLFSFFGEYDNNFVNFIIDLFIITMDKNANSFM